jgi:hypothetical protein
MACPQAVDEGDNLQMWRIAANMLNKQSQPANKGVVLQLGGLGVVLKTPHHKKLTS